MWVQFLISSLDNYAVLCYFMRRMFFESKKFPTYPLLSSYHDFVMKFENLLEMDGLFSYQIYREYPLNDSKVTGELLCEVLP